MRDFRNITIILFLTLTVMAGLMMLRQVAELHLKLKRIEARIKTMELVNNLDGK